jgi:prefoldin subunit 5
MSLFFWSFMTLTESLERQLKQLEEEVELFRRAISQIRESTEAIAKTIPTPKQIVFLASHGFPHNEIAVISRQQASEVIGKIKNPITIQSPTDATFESLNDSIDSLLDGVGE